MSSRPRVIWGHSQLLLFNLGSILPPKSQLWRRNQLLVSRGKKPPIHSERHFQRISLFCFIQNVSWWHQTFIRQQIDKQLKVPKYLFYAWLQLIILLIKFQFLIWLRWIVSVIIQLYISGLTWTIVGRHAHWRDGRCAWGRIRSLPIPLYRWWWSYKMILWPSILHGNSIQQ